MFLEYTDYRVVAGEAAFNNISQALPEVVERAEREAVEEISGYLRPKYDVDAVFAAKGDERNAQIVMVTADVALYHMVANLPQRMGFEIRDTRYRRAVKWLEDVAAGKVVPDLPVAGAGRSDAGTGNTPLWGSMWKRGNEW